MMHRELIRQPKHVQPTTPPPTPWRPYVIEGGKSTEVDPLQFLEVALFVSELSAFRRRRRRDTSGAAAMKTPVKTPEPVVEPEKVTGTHPVLTNELLDQIAASAIPRPDFMKMTAGALRPTTPKRQNKPREWVVSDEVAEQFVRVVLGHRGDLDSYLDKAAERVMRERAQSKQKFKAYREVRALEWLSLQRHVRTYVLVEMVFTGRRDPEGHDLRRSFDDQLEPLYEAALCSKTKRILRIEALPAVRKKARKSGATVRPRHKRQRRFFH